MVDGREQRCALPLPGQSQLVVQYVARITRELQRSYTFADASSRHEQVYLRQLDWFSALDADGVSSVRGLMAEADPDVILGADIVRFSFRLYHREF